MYNADKIKSELYQRQEKQKTYYDRNAKLLDPLKEGDRVALKNESKGMWIPASVQMANNQPRSYTVESNGGVYRRNRRNLMKYGEVVDQRAFEQPAVITKPAVTFAQPAVITKPEVPFGQPAVITKPEVPFGQPTDIRTTKSGRIVKPPRRYGNCAV